MSRMDMMIGYTRWELYWKRDKLLSELFGLEKGTPEYNAVQGKINRINLLKGALSDWSNEHRGCWFCWDSMGVVEEDREDMKSIPGYDEEGVANNPDPENHYVGIPAIMRQGAKIRTAKKFLDIYDDDDGYNTYDIVSTGDGEPQVLLADISRCPYCGRDLDEVWGKEYRNNDKFWGVDEYSWDYELYNIDKEPWDDDEDDES